MGKFSGIGALHYANNVAVALGGGLADASGIGRRFVDVDQFTYTFDNFFHPFVGQLIQQLNKTDVAGMLDPDFLKGLVAAYSASDYGTVRGAGVSVALQPRTIDLSVAGPYANYNWELFYHIPVMVAVHLSSNQRFAEAQKWFHLVFDPTCTDTTVAPPQRFWKFLAFRNDGNIQNINALLTLLSTPDNQLGDATAIAQKKAVLTGYDAMLSDPFQPHVIARTRQSAYQWYVVMKYLDNLIDWGDNLFMQDTIETINEATLCYVLAANILGPRPQELPARGVASPRNFLQVKQAGLDPMGNALVELESQFPFNLMQPPSQNGNSADQSEALFGIGQSLYFCIPFNQTLLAYWDTVADRLFKIRNSQNILGVVQQLPLFDPPLDPGMLVKAAAAGIDIGSVVSGLNQPFGPLRSLPLIQKALELAGEVRSLGASLLGALEKGDAEQLALLRQKHEIELQNMVQNVRYLQWQHARETTEGLLKTRDSALERYTYYFRLLGLQPDTTNVPETFDLDHRELNEDNFDDAYYTLVDKYNKTVTPLDFPDLDLAQGSSPSDQSGTSGLGLLYLNKKENTELNESLPAARANRNKSSAANMLASSLTPIPSAETHLAFWGLGVHSKFWSGETAGAAAKILGDVLQIQAADETDQAGIASRTASYQRRADDWMLQANLAARELMQIGRQILASLIFEQVAYHDYLTVKNQVQQAKDVQDFLQSKFTSAVFYSWMQSGIASIYYQYYRFACDTARKAEQTMKRELMRPELDQTSFIKFNYWDSGHQGLLSGDALYLDVKRMEMAYHDNNKREIELARHVSLNQLDPLELLSLKITGSCTVSIPEGLYDRDLPGAYMRRIKNVSLSVPCVVGPYATLNCTLTLQRSTVRVSPVLKNRAYGRDPAQTDDRFVDYFGSSDIIVTSSGVNDSGMFETNLHEERLLPFEGAGAISTWTLTLPTQMPSFDYMTISDVILHIRYTARMAGGSLAAQATKELASMLDSAGQSGQAQMFCLRYDFPTEWSAFCAGNENFAMTLQKNNFPYVVQTARTLTIDGLRLYANVGGKIASVTPAVDLAAASAALSGAGGSALLGLQADNAVLTRTPTQQVFAVLSYHFGN